MNKTKDEPKPGEIVLAFCYRFQCICLKQIVFPFFRSVDFSKSDTVWAQCKFCNRNFKVRFLLRNPIDNALVESFPEIAQSFSFATPAADLTQKFLVEIEKA